VTNAMAVSVATPASRALGPALEAWDDLDLARAAGQGNREAFAELYNRYEPRVVGYCTRLLGSVDEAGDCAQEAFMSVLRRLPALEMRELNFSGYLFAAARNACYNHANRRRRAVPVEEVGEPSPDLSPSDVLQDPEGAALLATTRALVQAANSRLAPRHRDVLALREIEELSYGEIAEIMGMNENSVAQLISRARLRLRDELRGSTLASFPAHKRTCKRATTLLSRGLDGKLNGEATWLDGHMDDCEECRMRLAAMQEAGRSYRAWGLPSLTIAALLARRAEAHAATPAPIAPRGGLHRLFARKLTTAAAVITTPVLFAVTASPTGGGAVHKTQRTAATITAVSTPHATVAPRRVSSARTTHVRSRHTSSVTHAASRGTHVDPGVAMVVALPRVTTPPRPTGHAQSAPEQHERHLTAVKAPGDGWVPPVTAPVTAPVTVPTPDAPPATPDPVASQPVAPAEPPAPPVAVPPSDTTEEFVPAPTNPPVVAGGDGGGPEPIVVPPAQP
jgi:RNA polymerase sigma factor (sigma-70 family)